MGNFGTVTDTSGTTNTTKLPEEPNKSAASTSEQGDNENNDQTPGENDDQLPGQNDDQLPGQNNDQPPGQTNDQDPIDSDLPPETQSQIASTGDRFNENMVRAAVRTSARGKAQGEDENEFFDTLPLQEESAKSASGAVENEDGDLKAQIKKLRKGNLYKAVLVGRLLNENQKNPLSSTAGGRFSRFMDSSALDTASDVNAIASNGISMLSTLNTNSTASKTFQAMSLVTNLLTIVSSCRNMVGKVRKMYGFWEQHKAGGHASKIDAALTVLGMVSDTLVIMVKGVAIVKTIMSLAGKNNKIMNMISNAMFLLTGSTQIIGALNGIRGVQKGYQELKGLKKDSEKPRESAMRVVERKNDLPVGTTDSWSESDRIKAVKELLRNKNNGDGTKKLDEQEEEKLILYLGLTKRITKSERSLAVTGTGLINTTIGFFSTAVSGSNTAAGWFGVKDKTLKDASTGMGLVANASNIAASSAKIANKAASSVGSSRNLIKQSLWDKIMKLTANHRGLKGLDHALAKPPQERPLVAGMKPEIAARETVALYENTNAQLGAMRVPYAKLLRAGSKSKFQNLLVDNL